jgi:hypothetical protein
VLQWSEVDKSVSLGLVQNRGRSLNSRSVLAKLILDQSQSILLLRESFQCQEAKRLSSSTTDGSVLQDFLRRSQLWSRERVRLPRRLRSALWALIPVQLLWGIWLATIVTGATSCRGPICMVASLHQHAAALLACGVFCVAGLVGLIPTTRGLSKCNSREVVGLAIASAAGGAALLGVAALVIGALIILIILATFVLALTATS